MKKRIGLFTSREFPKKKDDTTTTTTYIEVDTPAELVAKLNALGAKRVGLLRRDRLGGTHLEGTMIAPAELNAGHVDWLAGVVPEFETRGLFYEHR
jgi:hypothetical protein